MSATPEDVKYLIACEENLLYQNLRNSSGYYQISAMLSSKGYSITEYFFPRDYSFVDIHFFLGWEEITELIASQESNEKWLIFVSSKDIGVKLKKDIAGSEFIDAAYKASHPEKIQKMARTGKFDEQILIATTVLYNGFSFDDNDLRNIVVDSADRVEVLQMLGRKRLSKNETIKLYVMKKGQEEIRNLKRICEENYNILQELSHNPSCFNQNRLGKLTESQQNLFAIDQRHFIKSNPYAPYQLACLMGRYERLEDRFSSEGDIAFFNEVCSWFNIQYRPEMGENLQGKVKKQIINITEQRINQPMSESELKIFREQFQKIIKPLIGEMNQVKKNTIRNDNGRPASDINHTYKYFALPYQCKKTNNQWTISKSTNSSDSNDR